ncbi:uncharacterized protein ISCGN_023095 [Ixodes scapularis]
MSSKGVVRRNLRKRRPVKEAEHPADPAAVPVEQSSALRDQGGQTLSCRTGAADDPVRPLDTEEGVRPSSSFTIHVDVASQGADASAGPRLRKRRLADPSTGTLPKGPRRSQLQKCKTATTITTATPDLLVVKVGKQTYSNRQRPVKTEKRELPEHAAALASRFGRRTYADRKRPKPELAARVAEAQSVIDLGPPTVEPSQLLLGDSEEPREPEGWDTATRRQLGAAPVPVRFVGLVAGGGCRADEVHEGDIDDDDANGPPCVCVIKVAKRTLSSAGQSRRRRARVNKQTSRLRSGVSQRPSHQRGQKKAQVKTRRPHRRGTFAITLGFPTVEPSTLLLSESREPQEVVAVDTITRRELGATPIPVQFVGLATESGSKADNESSLVSCVGTGTAPALLTKSLVRTPGNFGHLDKIELKLEDNVSQENEFVVPNCLVEDESAPVRVKMEPV